MSSLLAATIHQKMASLDKYSAALFAKWLVQTHMGTSNPGASWIASMLILKDTLNYKNLLTAVMLVGIEIGLRRPAN